MTQLPLTYAHEGPLPYSLMHMNPDADALCSAWLLDRYYFPLMPSLHPMHWSHVPFNRADPAKLQAAVAVVDIGGVYDPRRLRFDHHQLVDAEGKPVPRSASATSQVYQFLTAGYQELPAPCPEITYLAPLVDLIHAGDTGWLEARGWGISTVVGLHASVSAIRSWQKIKLLEDYPPPHPPDLQVRLMRHLDTMHALEAWALFDRLALHLNQRASARIVAPKLVYRSADNRVVGLDGGAYGAVGAAFEEGAQLVVNTLTLTLPESVLLEIWRAHGVVVSVRDLLARTRMDAVLRGDTGMVEEIDRLYKEEAFAVRGTDKAPNTTLLTTSVQNLAAALDITWRKMDQEGGAA